MITLRATFFAVLLLTALAFGFAATWTPSCTTCQWQLNPDTGTGVPVTFVGTGLNPRSQYFIRVETSDPLPGFPNGDYTYACCSTSPDINGNIVYPIGFANYAATYRVDLYQHVHGSKPNPLMGRAVITIIPAPRPQ